MILDRINEGADDQIIGEGSSISDINALMENFFYDVVSCMEEDARKQYLESDECKALLQENGGFVGRRTFVRLNRVDDLSRRIKLAVYQKAKEDGDPNYKKLKIIQRKKHELNAKLMAKYANRVKKDAVKAQRALIKITPNAFTRPLR